MTVNNHKENSIRKWYISVYPHDELGNEISKETIFVPDESNCLSLFDILDFHMDVYDYIGVMDSCIRERIFTKLALIMNVSYDYIYDQWISC